MKFKNVKLGIAPIGWTNDDVPELGGENTFEQCISEMALAGFHGTEVGNKYPKDVKILRKALELRGLEICNAWFGACFSSKPAEVVLNEFTEHRNFLYEMGAKVIGAAEVGNGILGVNEPIFDAKPVYTDKQWDAVIDGYNFMAMIAEEKGMKLACHHHMGTGIQTMEEVDRFMACVNKNVHLLYDSGHIFYSEGTYESCLELIEKYSDRIAHVHLKDVRAAALRKVKEEKLSFLESVILGVFTVPGDGSLDFKPILQLLADKGYEGWLVVEAEQDPAMANPFEYALKARTYINETTGL